MTIKENERANDMIALIAAILLTTDESYHDGDGLKVDGERWAVVAAENIYEFVQTRNSARKIEDRIVEKDIEDFHAANPEKHPA